MPRLKPQPPPYRPGWPALYPLHRNSLAGAQPCSSTSCPAFVRMIARAPARSRLSASTGRWIGRICGAGEPDLHRRVWFAPRSRATPSASIIPSACRQPLRRVGEKGVGRAAFAPISWDAALDEVAEGFECRCAAPRPRGGVALLLFGHDGAGAARRHQPAASRDALFARGSHDLQHADRHRLGSRGRRAARRRRARDRQIRPDRGVGRQPGLDPGQRHGPTSRSLGASAGRSSSSSTRTAPPGAEAADVHLAPLPGTDGALACAVYARAVQGRLCGLGLHGALRRRPLRASKPISKLRDPAWAAAITGLFGRGDRRFRPALRLLQAELIRVGYGFSRSRNGSAQLSR